MVCIFDSDFVTHTVYSLYWVDKIDKYKKTKKPRMMRARMRKTNFAHFSFSL